MKDLRAVDDFFGLGQFFTELLLLVITLKGVVACLNIETIVERIVLQKKGGTFKMRSV